MIDKLDANILTILQENARTSNVDVARRVGLAPSAVLERIRKMERRGVIRGYEPRLSPAALGAPLVAFIFVHGDEKVGAQEIGRKIAKIPEVQEVHSVAGEDCYLVKVRVSGTDGLAQLLRDSFGTIPGIRSTRTTIVLSSVKETAQMPLPADPTRAPGKSRRAGPKARGGGHSKAKVS